MCVFMCVHVCVRACAAVHICEYLPPSLQLPSSMHYYSSKVDEDLSDNIPLPNPARRSHGCCGAKGRPFPSSLGRHHDWKGAQGPPSETRVCDSDYLRADCASPEETVWDEESGTQRELTGED